MGIITGPIQIDPVADTFNFCGNGNTPVSPGSQSFIDNWGPFPVGGLSVFGDFSGSSLKSASWNSTDDGVTWAEQDSANEPQSGRRTWAGSRIGSTFYLAAIDSGTFATAYTKRFDLTTKTWGAALASLDLWTVGINTFRPYIKFAQRSDGTGVLIYFGRQTGATKRVLWASTDGASWLSSGNVIKSVADANDAHIYIPYCAFADAADRVHFFFGTSTDGGDTANGLWYGVVNLDGTSSTTEVFTEAAYPNSFQAVGMGCIWNNKICLPYGDVTGLRVLYGGPLSAPVFTNELVSAVVPFNFPVTGNGLFATSCLVSDSGNLHAVWDTASFNDPQMLNYIYHNMRTTTGTWGTDDVVLSSAVLNVLNPGDEFWIHNISANVISPGLLGIIFDQTGCATMYYLSWRFGTATMTLACPVSNTISVGVPYSGTLVRTGGTGPFTFAIIAGALPPGFSLNVSTGAITGTTSTVGSWTYTAQVTDSLGASAEVTCSFNVSSGGGSGGGSIGSCRTVLHLWQHSQAPQVEITKDRNDDWTDCGTPGLKFFQGFKLDADTFGVNKDIQTRSADDSTLHVPQPSPINHQGRQTKPYSFATPFLAHSVRRESLDSVAWRKFGITYVWEPSPEFTYTWKTQRTSHGLSGFHHVQRMLFAYASSDVVTLTVTAFDGVSPAAISLPSTGGVPKKVVIVLSFNKGLTFQYGATSPAPFQIWKEDIEVMLGSWSRQGGYLNYPLLGGNRGDQASL